MGTYGYRVDGIPGRVLSDKGGLPLIVVFPMLTVYLGVLPQRFAGVWRGGVTATELKITHACTYM